MLTKRNNLSGTALLIAVVILNLLSYVVATLVQSSPYGDWLYTAILQFLILFSVVLLSKHKGFKLKTVGGYAQKIDGVGVLITLSLTVCVFVMGLGTSSIVSNLFALLGYESYARMPDLSTPLNFILSILAFCLMPALSEESLMRATVLPGVKKWTTTKRAVIFSALAFALLHGSVTQCVHQFVIGIVCAVLFLSGKSVWYGVILHFANNLFAIVLHAIQTARQGGIVLDQINPEVFFANSLVPCIIFALVGAVGVAFSLVLFLKRREKKEGRNGTGKFFDRVDGLYADSDTGDFIENRKEKIFFWTGIAILSVLIVYNFVVITAGLVG